MFLTINNNIYYISMLFMLSIMLSMKSISCYILFDSFSKIFLLLTFLVFCFCSNLILSKLQLMLNTFITSIAYFFFICSNIFVLFFSFELILLPIILIVMMWGYQKERLQSVIFLMMYTMTFSLPSFFMIFTFINISCITFMFNNSYYFMSMVTYSVMISPFMVKFPVFFLHMWLPKAHVEAPSIGSMQLAGVLLKLGSYGFVRLNSLFKIQYSLMMIILFCLICCISMSCGAMQNDSKMVVAYNSIGHMNLMFMFTLMCFQSSKDASALLSITHGISSSMLFFMVGDFYQSMKTRSIFYFSSILSINFINNIIMLMFLMSNLGIPPFFSSFMEITIIGLWYSKVSMVFLYISLFIMFNMWTSIRLLVSSTKNNKSKMIKTFWDENKFMTIIVSLNPFILLLYM